ncbi:MAG: hypothetical protein R3F02_14330 [Thiolinea sp.]
MNDTQFRLFSNHDIDIQLDGRGNNRLNSYGTYSPAMTSAPGNLREVILAHESRQPTSFTDLQALKRCPLISAEVELDNVQKTSEWLVTTPDDCIPVSPSGLKTFWLIQYQPTTGVFAVILSGRGQQRVFIPKQSNASGYRALSLQINNTYIDITGSQETRRYKANCKKRWEVHNGYYVAQPDSIEVWALDPITNSNAWLKPEDAFRGQTVTIPTVCPLD